MKTKEKKELQIKTVPELRTLVKNIHEDLFALRIEASQMKLKNTSSLAKKRKEIAQILTVLREKELLDENT